MKNKFLLSAISLVMLLTSSCTVVESTSTESEEESFSSEKSNVESSTSSKPSSGSSSLSSKQSSSVSSSKSSSESKSSKSNEPTSQTYVSENYELQSNPEICDSHELVDEIIRPATIIQKGIIRHKCEKCGGFAEEFYYDFNEFAFNDAVFSYDGNERQLRIEGMLPYGCTVKYENNKITEIGEQEAVANIYDEEDNLVLTKKAKIKVVENVGLPVLKINTATNEDPNYKDKDNYTEMTVSIENCDSKYLVNDIPGGIRVRGNSTNQADVSKRAWRMKFNSKINLLGLHKGQKFKSWVLLADYFDHSMYRNLTGFSLGNSLFNYSGNYSTDYKHINVYMNGDYRGVYLLAEQQQANKNRINVAEAEDGNTAEKVGYLVEIDGIANHEDYSFNAGPESLTGGSNNNQGWGGFPGWGGGGVDVNGVNVGSKSYAVKTDVYDQKQVDYIQKYIKNVQTAFASAVSGGPLKVLDEDNNLIESPYDNQYETLNSFIDLESVFRMYVLQEFMKNYDCGWGSFYVFVDFTEGAKYNRCTLGAPWDFDLGSGNKNNQGSYKPTGDFITKVGNSMTEFNPWLYLLSQADFFKDMFKKYYSVFANSGMYEKTMEFISYEYKAFEQDFANNVERWKNGTGKTSMSTRQYTNHKDAVEYLLNWYSQRKEYLDNTYLK